MSLTHVMNYHDQVKEVWLLNVYSKHLRLFINIVNKKTKNWVCLIIISRSIMFIVQLVYI